MVIHICVCVCVDMHVCMYVYVHNVSYLYTCIEQGEILLTLMSLISTSFLFNSSSFSLNNFCNDSKSAHSVTLLLLAERFGSTWSEPTESLVSSC